MTSSAEEAGQVERKWPPAFPRQRVDTDALQTLPRFWRNWPELSVRIDDLPLNVSTQEIWQWFSPYGEIYRLDIFEPNRFKSRTMSARIRFEPPPQRAFWTSGFLLLEHPNQKLYPRGLKAKISLGQECPRGWIESQVNPGRRYPAKIKIDCHSLDWGAMVGTTTLNIRKTLIASGTNNISLELEMNAKRCTVYFSIPRETRQARQFKFVVALSEIKTILYTSLTDGANTLVIPLRLPPHYFWRSDDLASSFASNSTVWHIRDTWNRATDVVSDLDAPSSHPVRAACDIPDVGYIEIGRWTSFRLTLKSDQKSEEFEQLKIAFEDLNVKLQNCDCFRLTKSKETMWDLLDQEPVNGQDFAATLWQTDTPHVDLSFSVRYQLEVCISRGVLNEHTVSTKFLEMLASLPPVDATRRLEYLVDQGEPLHDPLKLFEDTKAQYYLSNARIPPYCTLVRKANITPTTIRFSSPVVETSNRVVRHFRHVQDRFLRVQFIEESEIGRMSIACKQNDSLWKRLTRALYQGIQIGDRKYEFLAFGNSQMRQCGVYFFCPTAHISCDDIRRWMGDFRHIRVIAKHSARLGQCFSTTREMRGMPVPRIKRIPDIERNGQCFTDGVGVISGFLARMIVEEMKSDVFNEPSAFQFRMGGSKGVLAVWPRATGQEVHIRPSQIKFKADIKNLEIIRCARFANATLNRQTITILESLGVPIKVFVDLLDHQISLFDQAMTSVKIALAVLTKMVDENQSTLVLAEFLRADFKTDRYQEPFVMNLLNLWRSWSLKLLKEKARIHLEESAFVIGCADETGLLRGHSAKTEGCGSKDVSRLPQIFLQLSDTRDYRQTRIIKGICIVGRNPSLHPGDIRVVQAVDIPELHHLRDVVVFPTTGDRPVPSLLSGGDLDGDDFFVIWDRRLIPTEWNHPAMDFTANKPIELDRDVHIDDLKDFFVNYQKNDVLPLIATAHLAWADMEGPKSKRCLHLASLHSQAVDYPKTGEPAQWQNRDNPRSWPHFMEKKSTYRSRKALGVLYDKVIKQTIEFSPDWQRSFDKRILTRFELDDAILMEAREIKAQYDIAVRRILFQHNVDTEFELYTAWAMSGPAIGSDYKRQEDLGREYDALKQRFRDMCCEAAGGYDETKLDRFVAAMYTVTEEQIIVTLDTPCVEDETGIDMEMDMPQELLQARSMPLISFPWIFPWVMIRVASGGKCNPKKSVLAAAHRMSAPAPITKPGQSEHRRQKRDVVAETTIENGAGGVAKARSEEVSHDSDDGDEGAAQAGTNQSKQDGVKKAMEQLLLFDDD